MIRHLIFLIHPGIYRDRQRTDPEWMEATHAEIYLNREEECIARWLEVLENIDESTFVVQHCAVDFYEKVIKPVVGGKNSCLLCQDPPSLDDYAEGKAGVDARQHDFHINLVKGILGEIKERGFEYDPCTVTSEVWGESFEGCAPAYGGTFAHGLGLKITPVMKYEMNVYDSRFLKGSKLRETIKIGSTDIEAFIFELYDGTFAALYQSRLSEFWLDRRPITIMLDPTVVYICTTMGPSIWPKDVNAKAGVVAYTMTASMPAKWLRGHRICFSEFRDLVANAKVGPTPEICKNNVHGGDFWQASVKK